MAFKRPKFSSMIIVFVLFLVFLFFSFPFENLKGQIFAQIYSMTRILIVADEMSFSFFGWPGVSLRNVNVTLPLGENELELASEKLAFKVGLGGLFPPSPSATMNLKRLRKGGDLYMRFSQSGNVFNVKLEASAVSLEQLALPGLSRPLQGSIGSNSNVKVDRADLSKSLGSIEIRGDGLKTPAQMVEGMPGMSFAIPGLNIGKIETIINLKNGMVELTSIKLGDAQSDLSGTVTGNIKLGQDLQRSQVDVTVRLQLSQKILQDPQNKTFVSFLEGYQIRPGEYGMRWNAMVAELSGLSIKILPEKVTN